MKEGIHPEYHPEAKVTCACGNSWVTGSTSPELKIDICNQCHPFFTGAAMRIVDAGGQVERFTQRVEQARVLRHEAEEREVARVERQRARQLVEIVDEEDEIAPIDTADDEPAEAKAAEEPQEDAPEAAVEGSEE